MKNTLAVPEIRKLKQSICPSLSNRSELTFEYGYHEQSKAIMFRITNNTGSGHFCDHWVPLDVILKCLQEAKEPFSLSVFKNLYSGSHNSYGFLGAILVTEQLILCKQRRYHRKGDPKTFVAELNKLIKPAKATSKKASKKEASK
jgi:hypothetical protein